MKRKIPVQNRLAIYSIIFFILYIVIIFSIVFYQIGNWDKVSSPVGIDYRMLYTAGRTTLEGHAAEIYNVAAQQAAVEKMLGKEMPKDLQWFYPPTFLLIVVTLLSAFPFSLSLFLWLTLTLTLAVFAAYRLVSKQKKLALLILGFPGVLLNFRWGQNSFLSTALLGFGIAFMKRNPVLSGLMFGLLTYKPQLAFFPFLVLLVTKEWKVLRWSVFFTFMTVLLSAAAFGTDVWLAFLHQFFNNTSSILTTIWVKTICIQPTLYTALRLFGFDGLLLKLLIVFAGIVTTVLSIVIWKTTDRIALRGSAMALGTFVFMPYFIQYDLMVLSIPFILLVYDFMERGCGKLDVVALALFWIMPLLNMVIVDWTHIQVIPFLALGTMVLVFWRAKSVEQPYEQQTFLWYK